MLVSDPRLMTLIALGKGWLFVAVTAAILYVQVAAELRFRARQQSEIAHLNTDLEQRVQARTAELQTTLQELEAFSYSVSHDLRAPLRVIDGFDQMLQEDYAGQLDQQGVDYLKRIHAASQKMSQLIDALLQLSRVTRSELVLTEVDLSQMAHEIIAEAFSDRQDTQWVISPDIKVRADPTLMRVVLVNLLGNAYKYSSHQEHACIELGTVERDKRNWIYVRDNGVGFDMAYAPRLFEAFQRLHTEFEGTGIGLALVQRIIRRHGGEIQVEAESNKGATFYFYV
jgi:light-regulated signal transduction histidine kinase (bacteriophytochrome)